MSTAIQRRRGTSVQHLAFTGLLGEITVDTDKKVAVVHDGSTAGGITLLRQDMANYDGTEINNFRSQAIDDNVTNHTAQLTLADAGITIGSPTGGTTGSGTINAAGLFLNGSVVVAEGINANITADWQFSGDVSFTGNVTNVNSTDTNVQDNLLTLNDNEIANGIAGGAGTSGLRIDRGFSSAAVATTGDLTFSNANPDTIKRASGSWTADGVIPGSYVSISGSVENDGVYLVASVTTTDTANDTVVLNANENLFDGGPETVGTVTVLNTANTQASLIFDEADDTWKLGLAGAESAISTSASPGTTISVGDTSVVVTDTGTDGTITFTTDGTVVSTLTDTTFSVNVGSFLFGVTGVSSPVMRSNDGWFFQIDSDNDSTSDVFQIRTNGTVFNDGTLLFEVTDEGSATLLNGFTVSGNSAFGGNVAVDGTYALKLGTSGAHTYQQLYGATGFVAETQWFSQNAAGSTFVRMDDSGVGYLGTNIATSLILQTNSTTGFLIDANQNVVVGIGELADAATDGFFYLPTTTTGAPTGIPTTHAGRVPLVYDDTTDVLYVYNGSWIPTGVGDGDGLAYAIAFG